MKDQYFGDDRDYFKYDLIINLATCLQIPRFTNIVMLTPPDDRGDGNRTNYDVENRSGDLHSFLQASVQKQCRKVSHLREFFDTSEKGIEYLPYRDDTFFDGQRRDEYFRRVPPDWMDEAVILVDPDIGLKPQSPTESSDNHVLPREMNQLRATMRTSSILVMIQFRGRMKWCDRFAYLKEKIGRFDAIYNSDIAFICLTEDHGIRTRIKDCLRGYATDQRLDIWSA